MSTHFDSIASTLDRFASAWKANDGVAVASFFVNEGTLINPFGQRADGRDAVAAMYSEYFKSMLQGTSTGFVLGTVRTVEGGYAFIDAEQTIYAADGTVVLAVHLAALLGREGDDWRFVDGRPYTFAAPRA